VAIAEDDGRGDRLRLLWGSVRLCVGGGGGTYVDQGAAEVVVVGFRVVCKTNRPGGWTNEWIASYL